MIRVIDGEKLPAPEPPHWQDSELVRSIDPFNPFVIVPAFIFGGLLRSLLGRLLGSAADRRRRRRCWPGSWSASLVAALIVGVIAFARSR